MLMCRDAPLSWPPKFTALHSWMGSGHVAGRMPLYEQLQQLQEEAAGQMEAGSGLFNAKIADLHPYSW